MADRRKNYPSDVTDEEWGFCVRYLTLMTEEAPQREYPLRELFNGLRWFVRAGCPWRMMPNDLPPWSAVYQQTQRWLRAGCFEAMAHDLRAILRLVQNRNPDPSAVILDSRTLQSTPESGGRAGFDGHKKRKGSKVHMAVDTLGHLLALRVTPANEQDRAQVGELAKSVQGAVDEKVELKVTPVTTPPPRRPKKESTCRWSNITKPNTVLCCCRDAGLSSAHLLGQLASGVWPGTTSVWPAPWQVITG
jgi:transposase